MKLAALLLVASAAAAASESGSSLLRGAAADSNNVQGLLPTWTYIVEGAPLSRLNHLCLQTHTNLPILLLTKKANAKNSHGRGVIKRGKTCAELGYSKKSQYNLISELPKIAKVTYAGVTVWYKPYQQEPVGATLWDPTATETAVMMETS